MDDDIEYTLLNKRECMLYQIPPAQANGHKADDWKQCVWRGRLQISAKGNDLFIKFIHVAAPDMGKSLVEVKVVNGECDKYVERTLDSSRYFAIRVVDASGAKKTFIGLGFEDRNDAFDFNCCIQDFKNRNIVEQAETLPTKDYSLKEGEKITVNFKGLKKKTPAAKPAAEGISLGAGFLPPPPGYSRKQEQQPIQIAPPAVESGPSTAASTNHVAPTDNFFADFEGFQSASTSAAPPVQLLAGLDELDDLYRSAPQTTPAATVPNPGSYTAPYQLPEFSSAPAPLIATSVVISDTNVSNYVTQQANAIPQAKAKPVDPFEGLF